MAYAGPTRINMPAHQHRCNYKLLVKLTSKDKKWLNLSPYRFPSRKAAREHGQAMSKAWKLYDFMVVSSVDRILLLPQAQKEVQCGRPSPA